MRGNISETKLTKQKMAKTEGATLEASGPSASSGQPRRLTNRPSELLRHRGYIITQRKQFVKRTLLATTSVFWLKP